MDPENDRDYPIREPSHAEPEPGHGTPLGGPAGVVNHAPPASFIYPDELTLERVYRAISVGMEPYAAMLLAELTDEQIKFLDEDPDFNRHVKYHQNKKEFDLLTKLDDAMRDNLAHGITTEARWLLSKLNRKRFGNGPLEVGGTEELPPLSISKKE